jgi:hypothetical protein
LNGIKIIKVLGFERYKLPFEKAFQFSEGLYNLLVEAHWL